MLRLVVTLALALLPSLGLAQKPELMNAGKLTWGSSITFPPFEYEDKGKPAGFDVDLADALANKMGLQPVLTPIEFKGLIPALLGKRIDIVISGMYINPQRLEVADFVPYLLVGNQIVVRPGNPKHIESVATLCGLRVASPVGTVFEASANQASASCKSQGKPDVTVLSLPGTTNCALALNQDRADAIIVSTGTLAALLHETPGGYAAGGAPFDTDTKLGIAVRKDDPGLKAALEKAMQAIVADGTYAGLIRKWNLPAASSAF
ncbi:MAG TPA: ABC transporter substrate-binding protein [Acetobacteraceae bacterium]|nr:ABC transporter substrate-binding protein [Acetobacteraceae bacterium]